MRKTLVSDPFPRFSMYTNELVGRFVPTRRTPAISTSDLLERIVRGYRDGFFDSKLEKNGHPELLAADVDWDSSASIEKREKRAAKVRK